MCWSLGPWVGWRNGTSSSSTRAKCGPWGGTGPGTSTGRDTRLESGLAEKVLGVLGGGRGPLGPGRGPDQRRGMSDLLLLTDLLNPQRTRRLRAGSTCPGGPPWPPWTPWASCRRAAPFPRDPSTPSQCDGRAGSVRPLRSPPGPQGCRGASGTSRASPWPGPPTGAALAAPLTLRPVRPQARA